MNSHLIQIDDRTIDTSKIVEVKKGDDGYIWFLFLGGRKLGISTICFYEGFCINFKTVESISQKKLMEIHDTIIGMMNLNKGDIYKINLKE